MCDWPHVGQPFPHLSSRASAAPGLVRSIGTRQTLLLQSCTSSLGNSSPQRQGRSSVRRRVRLRLMYFVVLILTWSKASSNSDLIISCNCLQGQLLTFLHIGGIWCYSMPRLCAKNLCERGEFACEQGIMLIHSKPDLFSPLQLLVPLWSTRRLPMQPLAPHWEFAGASSQMTLSSGTNCAINPWATRGAVTTKQVRRPGPKGTPQSSTGKTSWFQSASGLAVATCLCTLFANKTVVSAITFPVTGFVTLPLPCLPYCQLQQDPSQEQRQDGIARVGRGQWMESGLNSSISFTGGWALH